MDNTEMLIDLAPVMVRRWTAALECAYCNKRWLDFRGRAFGQEKGIGWRDGLHPEDASWCVGALDGSAPPKEAFWLEYRLRRHDGAWRRVFEQWEPVPGQDGRIAEYISAAFDITDKPFAAPPAPHGQTKLVELCASCKKVREGGTWHTFELYLERNTPFKFSHGLCPACNERLYERPRKDK